ncbi:MAG: hypothetical protein JWM85_3309 [Acidimicrobiaceae bacterium]|nr:hypothetical protein [Acidimicrobiaceae bacterium]
MLSVERPGDSSTSGSRADEDPDETPLQRARRNFSELVQELRVAGLGIQVLFGFLLALPFNQKFSTLSGVQHGLYVTTLILSAFATAFLGAPVAYHRIVFRQHEKERLVRLSNGLVIAGLACVALAVSCAVALIVSVVDRGWEVPLLTSLVFGSFLSLWLLLPLISRIERPEDE